MRLIECYIENFGKLSKKSISFKSGLNTILEDNGWGKSTLVAFIKAMFYGMPGDGRGSKDIEKNERKRYAPWQGGAYGGALKFSIGKKEYRIEREFGKSDKDDSFKLYDALTNKESNDYTLEIGKELFEINEEGFMRTVLLSDKALEREIKDKSIHTKLSNLVGVDGDVGNFEIAQKRLEMQRKVYSPRSKSGIITATENLIKEQNQRLAEAQRAERGALEIEDEIAGVGKEISLLETKEREEKRKSAAIMKRDGEIKLLREKKGAIDDARIQLESYEAFFKNGLPTHEAIDEHMAAKRECDAYNGTDTGSYLPYTFDEIKSDNERFRGFAFDFDRCEKELYEAKEKGDNAKTDEPNTKDTRGLIYIILALCIALTGILLGLLVKPILFTVCIAAVFPVCLLLTAKKSPESAGAQHENDTALTLEKRLVQLKDELDGIMAKYDLSGSYQYAKKRLDDMVLDARVNLEEIKKAERATNAIKEKRKKVADFVALYPTSSVDPLSEIMHMLRQYEYTKMMLERAKNSYDEFCRTHNIHELESEIKNDGEDFEGELKEIEAKLRDLRGKKAVLERDLCETSRLADEADAIATYIDELNERLVKEKDTLDTITEAARMLDLAKDSLVSKYIGSTKTAFNKYLSAIGIGEVEIKDIELDTSFEVKKNDMGKKREKESYSRGTQDAYNLALRLALIDALYESESPFIILDDPFAYLDDKKQKSALKTIKALSKEKQIIYLTCTEARA